MRQISVAEDLPREEPHGAAPGLPLPSNLYSLKQRHPETMKLFICQYPLSYLALGVFIVAYKVHQSEYYITPSAMKSPSGHEQYDKHEHRSLDVHVIKV